jgi:HK97 family phage prohead protease
MKYLPMTLKAVDTAEADTGEFEAILSTSAEDRDNEVIATGAFDPLPESIPIYYQHDWQQKALPIGRGTPFYDENGALRIKGYYGSDERSQAVRKAVGEGLVDSMSAGYLPLQKKRSQGKAMVTKADLFEGSMTAIPVNKTALVTASKALREASWYTADELRELEGISLKAGARNSTADNSRLQQIHDLAVENGASCEGMKSLADAEVKAEPDAEATSEAEPTDSTSDADRATKALDTDEVTTEVTGDPATDVATKSAGDEAAARLRLSETALRLALG